MFSTLAQVLKPLLGGRFGYFLFFLVGEGEGGVRGAGWGGDVSLSPNAGHNKAGRSDFRNQRFEPDTAKMRKMRKAPLTLQKQGFEETPQSKRAENAENAENADAENAADWF